MAAQPRSTSSRTGAAGAPAHGPATRHAAHAAATEAPAEAPARRKTARNGAAPAEPVPTTGPRTLVRNSPIHGRGVFVRRPIAAGDLILEYLGEVISWPEAQRRHPANPAEPNHTFYFHVDDERVIDGGVGGNAAKWINHACTPNCESEISDDGRVFIRALRDLKPGEELFYDYRLMLEERHTPKVKREYECRCGAANCRRTMLAPKR